MCWMLQSCFWGHFICSNYHLLCSFLLFGCKVCKQKKTSLIIISRDNVNCLFSEGKKTLTEIQLNSAYMKLLMNYFQMINIINYLELNWHSAIVKFQTTSKTLSGSFFKVISLECLFKSKYLFLLYFNILIV